MLPGRVSNKRTPCLQAVAFVHIPHTHHKNLPQAQRPTRTPRTRHNDLPEVLHHGYIPCARHTTRAHLLNRRMNFGLCFLAMNPVFIRRSKSSPCDYSATY